MQAYTYLPIIYDRLMQDVDYEKWSDFIIDLLNSGSKNNKAKNILELGCGSGKITEKLLEKGFEVVGIDSSFEMLEAAREKTSGYGDKVILLEQDISDMDFDVYEIEAVVAANDVFNYITDKEDIRKIFEFVHGHLAEGAGFVFDISSSYKISTVLGDNVFSETMDDLVYIWENYYDDKTKMLEMDINFFVKDSEETYKRYEEQHIQRAYEEEELKELLDECGFKNIRTFYDFKWNGSESDPERIFFSCIKGN